MLKIRQFIYAILAGICIGTGGIVFLSCENPVVGAILFGIGLFTILVFQLQLYTGKVGYLPLNKPIYIIELIITWVGNIVGTYITGVAVRNTRIFNGFSRLENIVSTKLNDDILSIFILSVFCGMLMFIAVEIYKTNSEGAIKVVGVFVPVVVFILCGFEHCVANMFYFSAAGVWGLEALFYIIVMTLGNSVGGILIPVCKKILGDF